MSAERVGDGKIAFNLLIVKVKGCKSLDNYVYIYTYIYI